jgi:hypothetical protein
LPRGPVEPGGAMPLASHGSSCWEPPGRASPAGTA